MFMPGDAEADLRFEIDSKRKSERMKIFDCFSTDIYWLKNIII